MVEGVITESAENTQRWQYPLEAVRVLVLNMIIIGIICHRMIPLLKSIQTRYFFIIQVNCLNLLPLKIYF